MIDRKQICGFLEMQRSRREERGWVYRMGSLLRVMDRVLIWIALMVAGLHSCVKAHQTVNLNCVQISAGELYPTLLKLLKLRKAERRTGSVS